MNEEFDKHEESRDGSESTYTASYSPEIKKERKGMSRAGIIALAICCSLLGGILGSAGTAFFFRNGSAELPEEPESAMTEVTPEPVIPETTPRPMTGDMLTAADVYEANVNSTVGITTSITTNFWGYQSTSAASGSGFILSEDGYILTNYHVINDSNSVTVTTFDNKSYVAQIMGYDIGNDIAVLKIDAQGLRPVTLGSSDALRVGDPVVAIGNPLGELTFSLTQGVVSALNREVTLDSGTAMDLIQTDAAINSGNSGGALFNMRGEVVGITNAKYSGSGSSTSASIDNIGFAIPIDHVRGIVKSIVENGYIVKPWIGVSVATVSAEMQSYSFPQGAAVKVINDDSPAQAAGLQVNDIITAVNGSPITTSSDLVNIVTRSEPGDKLILSVYRQNEGELEIELVVGEKQQSAMEEPERPAQTDQSPFSGSWGFPFGGGW